MHHCPHLVDEDEHDKGAHCGPDLGDHAAGEEVARVPAQPRHRHLRATVVVRPDNILWGLRI